MYTALISILLISLPQLINEKCLVLTCNLISQNNYSVTIKNNCKSSIFYEVTMYCSNDINGKYECVMVDLKRNVSCDTQFVPPLAFINKNGLARFDFKLNPYVIKQYKYFKVGIDYRTEKNPQHEEYFSKPYSTRN